MKSVGPWKAMMFVGAIGFDLAATTFGGFFLGRLLDRRFHTEPAFLIAGLLVGLATGIYIIYKMVRRFVGEG